ncbi:hypothetical protein GCM10025867_48170 (plasmid) [Frondihabitans sucicola]|uniref:DNA-binding protein n=1 Tax=Frondihabitans sucicola TaxID=1268041 RepID=A0ABN6XZM3_9MICO|nr:hypothetical protein [Frondihabitans sucicola]BDZ50519.1 hypothetical protein GCM10025867_27600 [Frondihabitans sucicola]BDZ52576.1 hypothetical protein GCM10025867_48170 [Frondihabitans sucicola]
MSLKAFGIDPVDTVNDLSSILEALSVNSLGLKKAHHLLLLERLTMEERPSRLNGHLEADDIREILARMSFLDVGMSLTPNEVASLLGCSTRVVLDDIEWGRLHAIRAADRYLLPSWQFEFTSDGRSAKVITQQMEMIVAAIPPEIPAAFTRAIMTLDDPTLPRRGKDHLSPRDFLLSGGSARPVAATLLRYLEGSSERLFEIWNMA